MAYLLLDIGVPGMEPSKDIDLGLVPQKLKLGPGLVLSSRFDRAPM